jgi:fructosamine-3-kinase
MPVIDHPLYSEPLRTEIERIISTHLGRAWQARTMQDLKDLASHPALLLSDGGYRIFAKLSTAANGLEQFEAEVAGLHLLAEQADVLIPAVIAVEQTETGALLLMEAVPDVARGAQQWREIGRTLARIHAVPGTACGLDTHGYFGPLYQDNRPLDSWAEFYAERRLRPRLASAIDNGALATDEIRQVERLIQRLPQLCGAEISPCLLHGDAQQNNFISSPAGAVVIDPAAYYGHPEMDLAYVNYFQAVPEEVFDGYRELRPIDPGFAERRSLWRIYGYLAIVTVEGSSWAPVLMQAVRGYL